MNFEGVFLGIATIGIIALARWLVIKGEYYFTKWLWIAFLLVGLVGIFLSLWITQRLLAAIASIAGFCLLWGIGELIQQEKRVEKGWFPKNPRRQKQATEHPNHSKD